MADAGFAEPAWDMLLYLFIQQEADVTIGAVCSAAAAPRTTALRIMYQLELAGRLIRQPTRDRRSSFIRLSERTSAEMFRIFGA